MKCAHKVKSVSLFYSAY